MIGRARCREETDAGSHVPVRTHVQNGSACSHLDRAGADRAGPATVEVGDAGVAAPHARIGLCGRCSIGAHCFDVWDSGGMDSEPYDREPR